MGCAHQLLYLGNSRSLHRNTVRQGLSGARYTVDRTQSIDKEQYLRYNNISTKTDSKQEGPRGFPEQHSVMFPYDIQQDSCHLAQPEESVDP